MNQYNCPVCQDPRSAQYVSEIGECPRCSHLTEKHYIFPKENKQMLLKLKRVEKASKK